MRSRVSSRAIKAFVLCVLLIFVILAVAVVCPDKTLASCFIDVVIIGLFLIPYYDDKPVAESEFSETAFAMCLIGTLLFWLVIQQTGLFLQGVIQDPLTDAYVGSGDPDSFLYLCLVLVFAPFMEELLFRDRTYRLFCRFVPSGWACVFTSILFGLVHGTVIHLYLGTMMGLFLLCVYRATGQLWVCVVLHNLFNLMSLWIYPGDPSGNVLWVVILAILNIFIVLTLFVSWSISRKSSLITRKKFCIL